MILIIIIVIIVVYLLKTRTNRFISRFLTNIGKLSLFVYLIHTLIISFLLTKFHFTIINDFTTFIITELLFIATILIICNLINIVKPYLMKYKMTKPILFILGL